MLFLGGRRDIDKFEFEFIGLYGIPAEVGVAGIVASSITGESVGRFSFSPFMGSIIVSIV